MKRLLALLLALTLLPCGCAKTDTPPYGAPYGGVWYEIFVGAFCDSDGDGIGDLQGVISKLDYLSETLGVGGIWLTPVNPSPSYHKYDVTDYYDIDPQFGTMEDFEQLIAECDARGIRLIIDLVLNHSSSRHPWFLAAVEELETGAEPRYQNYYNFWRSRIDEGWHPVADGWYYEGVFWSGMPDLNMDCGELREEIGEIARFWLEKGVAGFRLDAVKHIYHERDDNIEFLQWFSGLCREIKEDVFLIGEVWSGEGEILAYYESGLTAFFSFPFAGADGIIHRSLLGKEGASLAGSLENFTQKISQRDPDALHAPFLSNHDTNRSAGYILEPDRMKLEAAIYLLLPGVPFIYYGEEIAMTGSGADEYKRRPMLWETVERDLEDLESLLNTYREIIRLRRDFPDLQTGAVTNLKAGDRRVCALLIGETAVLHNLSGEYAEVDTETLCPGMKLQAFLSPSGDDCLEDGTLALPPYATAILR